MRLVNRYERGCEMKILKVGLITLALAWLAGCSAGTFTPASPNSSGATQVAAADVSKSVSTTYTYFFRDYISDSSAANWTVTNSNGNKQWVLSTANYFSAPRAWTIGGNYWNYENDFLESDPFTVPASRSDIRFVFYGKWKILNQDHGRVQYKVNSGTWTTLSDFSAGQNTDYPNWTKYSYTLPNTGPSNATYRVRFWFESDASLTDWGFGVDSVSVYQADMAQPTNIAASDGTYTDKVRLTWGLTSGITPTSYRIYRATSQNGTYSIKATQSSTTYDDTSTAAGTTYWYKIVALRSGYPDGPYSAPESGYRAAPPTWHVTTLDSSGLVGQGPSLRMVGANPAVSYCDDTNFGARYIRATDANGNTWGTPVQVASGVSSTTNSTSLLMVGTNPAIAFQRGNPKYSRATDATGTGWGSFVQVGSTNAQDSINLLMASGRPTVIARNPHIELCRANDASGNTFPTTTTQVDGANRPVSAAIVDGLPAVAYTTSTDQLAYRQATVSDGSAWGAQVLVDGEQFNNFCPSLAVINGRPAIAYVNGTDLVYIRANDIDGAGWPAAGMALAANLPQSGQTSIDSIGGKPAIAFSKFNASNRNLWYIDASNADGTAWNAAQALDTGSSVADYMDLEEINGKPGIAYYQITGENLKYAGYF